MYVLKTEGVSYNFNISTYICRYELHTLPFEKKILHASQVK